MNRSSTLGYGGLSESAEELCSTMDAHQDVRGCLNFDEGRLYAL